jgi:hypothetical protein
MVSIRDPSAVEIAGTGSPDPPGSVLAGSGPIRTIRVAQRSVGPGSGVSA